MNIDCQTARQMLHAYADDELDIAAAQRIAAHMEACADCRKSLAAISTLKSAVASPGLYRPAPRDLVAKLQFTMPPKAKKPYMSFWPFATAASLLLALGLSFMLLSGRGESDADFVISSHLRSLQANHLLDVPSTDQHTVKPWFDGKLDFAPPVRDLAAAGYPLIGGRLDDLHGQTVASLVYRRGKHTINLFIRPGTAPEAVLTRQGYNLISFNSAGMICWAVSDVNPADLQDFVRLFKSPAPVSTAP